MPSDQELSKLSDEHKAMLARKCVELLTRSKEGGADKVGVWFAFDREIE